MSDSQVKDFFRSAATAPGPDRIDVDAAVRGGRRRRRIRTVATGVSVVAVVMGAAVITYGAWSSAKVTNPPPVAATTTSVPTPTTSSTPSPTESSPPTGEPLTSQAAMDSAARILDAALVRGPDTFAGCWAGSAKHTCLTPSEDFARPSSTPGPSTYETTAASGLFSGEWRTMESPDGGSAGQVIFGYTGTRWAYWYGTQEAPLAPVTLPSKAYVCSRQGSAVPLLAAPDGAALADVAAETQVTATRFRLTVAGDPQGKTGTGWYEVSLSDGRSGWISSKQLSDASHAKEPTRGPCGTWSSFSANGALP